MNYTISHNKGFTLIELLVVISIIGLLSSVTMASLNSARLKGRDAARKSAAVQMRTALSLYEFDNGGYPTCTAVGNACTGATMSSTLNLPLTGRITSNSNGNSWWDLASAKVAHAAASYVAATPVDPLNNASYKYVYSTSPAFKTGYVDTNGATTGLSKQASFWYVSEYKTATLGSAYTEGILLGQADFVAYPGVGYPVTLSGTIGGASY